MHICVNKLTITSSDNGLSPGRRQAIIWTNAGILLIGSLGTNFSEILLGIQTFWFKKMHLKMSSAKWRPFCLGLNVLIHVSKMTPLTSWYAARSLDYVRFAEDRGSHRSIHHGLFVWFHRVAQVNRSPIRLPGIKTGVRNWLLMYTDRFYLIISLCLMPIWMVCQIWNP